MVSLNLRRARTANLRIYLARAGLVLFGYSSAKIFHVNPAVSQSYQAPNCEQHLKHGLGAAEASHISEDVFIPFSNISEELFSSVAAKVRSSLAWEAAGALDPFVLVLRGRLPDGELPSADKPFGTLLPVILKIPVVNLTTLDPPFYMFTLDPRSEGYGGASLELHRRGKFEDAIIQRISTHVRDACRSKGGLFVDVGTNIGFFSMLAASWGCKVIGFEANSMLHGLVQNSAKLNGFDQITVIPHGAGPTRQKVLVNNKKTCPSCSSMTTKTDPDAIEIEMVDISSYIHERPLFLKIDIDGYEIGALEGALAMLRKHRLPNGYVEFNPQWWERSSITRDRGIKLVNEMSKLGYVFSHTDGSAYPLREILSGINLSTPDSSVGSADLFFSLP